MRKSFAFILGVIEFRSDLTRAYDDLGLLEAYDIGRDLAHRLTFRKFDR